MVSRLLAASVGLLLLSAAAPHAQEEEPPTLLISSWKCDRAMLGDAVEDVENNLMPIAQDLVDEEVLWDVGVLRHAWGDEWNLVFVIVADDVSAAIAGNAELNSRYNEAFGDDGFDFTAACWTHRDAFHTALWRTEGPDGQTMPDNAVVSMSQYTCDFADLGEVIEDGRTMLMPAAQASVDAGMGYMTSASAHAWADEWTYTIWQVADDLNALEAFAQDTGDRVTDEGPGPLNNCRGHRDNLYRMVAGTE